MTDDKKPATYEIDVFNPVLSQKLADLTQILVLGGAMSVPLLH
jgi:hypothetical protein